METIEIISTVVAATIGDHIDRVGKTLYKRPRPGFPPPSRPDFHK